MPALIAAPAPQRSRRVLSRWPNLPSGSFRRVHSGLGETPLS